MKKGFVLAFFAGLAAFSASSALAATTVSGISACIMKTGGSAGAYTAPVQQNITVREPASGDYFDAVGPSMFGPSPAKPGPGFDYGPTIWQFFTKSRVNILYWGTFQTYYSPTPGQSMYWHADNGNVTSQYTPSGWTYHRGYYRSTNPNSGLPFESYGIYRTTPGTVTVPGNAVFEACRSNSTASNGNWVSGSFVRAQELNLAFSSFEQNMLNKISEKKLNLALVTEVTRVTEMASAVDNLFSRSTGFVGVSGSKDAKKVGLASEDATTFGNQFKGN